MASKTQPTLKQLASKSTTKPKSEEAGWDDLGDGGEKVQAAKTQPKQPASKPTSQSSAKSKSGGGWDDSGWGDDGDSWGNGQWDSIDDTPKSGDC